MSFWSKLGTILVSFGLKKLEKELDERLDDDKKDVPQTKVEVPVPTVEETHRAVEEARKKPVPVRLKSLELKVDGDGGFLFKPSDHHTGVVLLLPGNFPIASSVWLEGRGGRIDAVKSYTFMNNPDRHGLRQHWRWFNKAEVKKKVGKKPYLHVKFDDGTHLTFHLNRGLNHRYD